MQRLEREFNVKLLGSIGTVNLSGGAKVVGYLGALSYPFPWNLLRCCAAVPTHVSLIPRINVKNSMSYQAGAASQLFNKASQSAR